MNDHCGNADDSRAGLMLASEADAMSAVLDVLRHGKRFLVCSHARPDGDAIGSILAMGMLLKQMGKHVDMRVADKPPAAYCALFGAEELRTGLHVYGAYDAAILLECDSVVRTHLHGLEKLLLVNIDHHASGRCFAHVNWIDRDATSVGELIYRLAKAAGAEITPQMAGCLYATVLTDTGGFRYGSICGSTFAMVRELVEAGADPVRIAQEVYFSVATSKLLLLGAALNNLKREGRLAWLWVSHRDMMRTCASDEDCEGIVSYALSIAGVEAAAFLHELAEGCIRVSLRSKGHIDVAAIAGRMGGGGHRAAAGCTVAGPLHSALDKILKELRTQIAHFNEDRA